MKDSVCGDTCAGASCGLAPLGQIFVRSGSGLWRHLGTILPAAMNGDMSKKIAEYDVTGQTIRYALICRGQVNAYRSNIEVDDITGIGTVAAAQSQLAAASAVDAPQPAQGIFQRFFAWLMNLFSGI